VKADMRGEDMARFWNDRAHEDPFFFVDNRLDYGSPDLERFWAGGEQDLATILEAIGTRIEPGDEVVEIGCGVGRLTRPLAARGRSVRAVDVSERMIELAREHNPELRNVDWIVGDGTTLAGIADASADVCFSHVVLQHIPDPAISLGYVREMGRVLRPGGWAAFQFSNAPSVHRRPGLLGRLRHGRHRALRDPRWRGSCLSLDDVRAAAAGGGLAVDRVVGEGRQHCVALAAKQVSRPG
jgi:SAM-dependent methyltransferase